MSSQNESNEMLAKLESAVRIALKEIQRGGILCVPKSMEQRQLEGAVRIVMRHLVQECPELVVNAEPTEEKTEQTAEKSAAT